MRLRVKRLISTHVCMMVDFLYDRNNPYESKLVMDFERNARKAWSKPVIVKTGSVL